MHRCQTYDFCPKVGFAPVFGATKILRLGIVLHIQAETFCASFWRTQNIAPGYRIAYSGGNILSPHLPTKNNGVLFGGVAVPV
jgi:hypothetical protein